MDATITVSITRDQIAVSPQLHREDCGAVLDFHGVVRADEHGRQIDGLEYEAYQSMAERQMQAIIRELLSEFPCREVDVIHRIGFVPVGESSMWVRVAAPHRQEAISFLAEFMNRLKKDVPIWKKTSPSPEPQS